MAAPPRPGSLSGTGRQTLPGLWLTPRLNRGYRPWPAFKPPFTRRMVSAVDEGAIVTHSFKHLLVFAAADIAAGVNYSDSSDGTLPPRGAGRTMDFLFGADMPLAVRFFFAFVIVLALIGGTAYLVRRFGAERLGAACVARAPAAARGDRCRRRRRTPPADPDPPRQCRTPADDRRPERRRGRSQYRARRRAAREAARRARRRADRHAAARRAARRRQYVAAAARRRRPRRRRRVRRAQPVVEEPMQWHAEPEPPPPPPRCRAVPEPRVELRPEPRAEMRPEPRRMRPEPRRVRRSRPECAGAAPPMRPEPRAAPSPRERRAKRAGAAAPRADAERAPTRSVQPMRRREAAAAARTRAERARAPQPEPHAPAPRRRRRTDAANADQNLAEMAQRLEAALRRPKPPSRARRRCRAGQASRRAATAPSRCIRADAVRRAQPQDDATPPAAPQPRRSRREATKSVYDSLEQEMASLLGRPNSKT